MGAVTAWTFRRRRSAGGRSGPRRPALAELVVALGVVATVAGFTLPVALRRLEADRARRTSRRLAALAQPVRAFVRDTGDAPGAPGDLVRPPAGARGWAGPYLDAADPPADGWGRDLLFRLEGAALLAIVSAGPDGRLDSSDDLRRRVSIAAP